ncbi:MAG: hypothetical protein FJY11_02365, partial [Bacteroidetes bacterium]|nr:hypothetical protein [Bacteroidota bacterium]
ELLAELRRYDTVLKVLKRSIPEDESEMVRGPVEQTAGEIVSDVESLTTETEELRNRVQSLKIEASKIEAWGDYESAGFEKLVKSGWQISLFSCPSKKFTDEWHQNPSFQIINIDRGKTYFAVVHKPGEEVTIDADPEKTGEVSAPKLLAEAGKTEERIKEIGITLKQNAFEWHKIVQKGRLGLLDTIEYKVAEKQALTEADGSLMVLHGWVPVESEASISAIVEGSGVYAYESDPAEDEKVPVMLRNNKFSVLFEPISKLFDLPNYKELDLTPFFAPFFMLFFGFCLGDAGYGLVFIAAAFILYKKVPRTMRPFLSLAKYLGIATVVFGIISGTFFGMNLIDSGYTIKDSSLDEMKIMRIPSDIVNQITVLRDRHFETRKEFLGSVEAITGNDVLRKYKGAFLRASDPDIKLLKSFRHIMQDPLNMFYLAIALGAIQIIFGMIVKIINISIQRGFRHSLSTLGWVILLLTVVVFKGGDTAGFIDPEATKPLFLGLLGVAGVLIFLLNNLSINIFFRIGSGVWDTYNVATGIFGDLLSYIRLFALGISSGILGFVFNDISSQFLSIPYIGWLFFVLLLLIGHSINIFMASLGGFIHPMRLTFVEFYKNAGFRGGGKEYKPFRINS